MRPRLSSVVGSRHGDLFAVSSGEITNEPWPRLALRDTIHGRIVSPCGGYDKYTI